MLAIVLSVFFDLHILVISFVSFGHCVVCLLRFNVSWYVFGICWPLCCLSSSIYIFWLSLCYLLAIVLSVFFDLHILVISLVSVGHCVVCLLRFTYSGYLFAICWPLCCLSSSIYICWLSLCYLLAIVLSVFFDLHILVISLVSFGHWFVCLLRFKDSGYLFCIFLPLCCLSSSIYRLLLSLLYRLAIGLSVFFDLRILVISLKSVGHCVVCLLRFTDSCYLFDICWPLCCLSSLIYIFWLFLLYLLAIVLSVFFDLRFLGISLVSVAHCVVCLLRFTDSGYLFGICWPLCCLSSSIYIFWLSLWYLLAIVLSVFFHLQILVISLVSVGHCVVCLLRFTDSGYLFCIFLPLCCLSSSIYRFWLSLLYLLAIGLSVFFDLRILVISLKSVGHCVVSLL